MMLSGNSVLVTGATGFLGGTLTKRLAGDGALVRALARNPERSKSLQNIEGVEIVQGDVTDADRMREAARGCKVVFHTAAMLEGSMEQVRRVNVEGTRNVMKAAAEAGAERVVHVGSAGAYGFGRHGDITEEMPFDPGQNPYGVTKVEGEAVVKELSRELGIDFSIVRPGIIYGPGSSVWTEGIFKLARRKPTIFAGAGKGSIPAIYVEDVVDLMTVLAIHPAASGEAFNCTLDPSPTWREFLGAYSALAGHDRWLGIPIAPLRALAWLAAAFAPSGTMAKEAPQMIEFVTGYRRITMDKARNLLGWQPKISLEEGVRRCAPFLREKGLLR